MLPPFNNTKIPELRNSEFLIKNSELRNSGTLLFLKKFMSYYLKKMHQYPFDLKVFILGI